MRTFLEEVVTNGRLDLIETLAHSDVLDEANRAFGGPPGRAGLIAHVKGFRKNIGEPKIEIREIVGNDNQVMAWWSFSGIHSGPWLGIKATNQTFTAEVFSFFNLRDGRIDRYRLWLRADLDPPVTFDSRTGSR